MELEECFEHILVLATWNLTAVAKIMYCTCCPTVLWPATHLVSNAQIVVALENKHFGRCRLPRVAHVASRTIDPKQTYTEDKLEIDKFRKTLQWIN